LNSIGFKWRLNQASQTVPWETRFNELVQYKAKHGDCKVPKKQGKLGTWVGHQRAFYKKNKLSPDRVNRLNGIGFDWTLSKGRQKKREALPSAQEQSLIRNESVSLLGTNVKSVPVAAGASCFDSDRFKIGDGASGPALSKTSPTNAEPPASATRKLVTAAGYEKPPAAPVAREPAHRAPWDPARLRKETAAKEKKRAPLIATSMAPSEVVALTMKEGSVGHRRNKCDEQWDARFKELLDYRSEHHGDCDVPFRHGKLGRWVGNQRQAYVANSLAQDRIDRLNKIGFNWRLKQASLTVPWGTRFDELVQYKETNGDCNVPQSQGQLGIWVNTQREVYKKNKLSPDRVDRLNSIGFRWTLREVAPTVPWETRFDELVQYKAKHGDCNVPQSQGQLGIWVHTQRITYKKNKLSPDRINRLNSIGFDWTPPMGRQKKREALPITQGQSSMRNECVSLPSTNVESVSVAAGARYFESNRFASCFESNRFGVGDCASGHATSLPAPSNGSSHSRGTENDDRLDEH
ncbi:hypothetical protein THAOC_08524, partial [Thalassiosira oceanica]